MLNIISIIFDILIIYLSCIEYILVLAKVVIWQFQSII